MPDDSTNNPSMIDGRIPDRIIILGEVLIDTLPDGTEAIGGAPMNVAWNLRGLGRHPYLVSAVGADAAGQSILQRAEEWGLLTAAIQIDPDRPTGRIRVCGDQSDPTYEIPREQAYDYIRYPHAFVDTFSRVESPILYHGTLCARSPVSFETTLQLRRRFESNIVVDLNLREGQFTRERIDQFLTGASVLKCNLAELETITGRDCCSDSELRQVAETLVSRSSLRELWVTCGSGGAWWFDSRGHHAHAPSDLGPEELVDTVGAGDAFMAAVLNGIATDMDRRETLELGIRLATRICRISGATPSDSETYRDLYQYA